MSKHHAQSLSFDYIASIVTCICSRHHRSALLGRGSSGYMTPVPLQFVSSKLVLVVLKLKSKINSVISLSYSLVHFSQNYKPGNSVFVRITKHISGETIINRFITKNRI